MSSFLLIQHFKDKSNSIPITKYTGILKIFFSFISTLKLQIQVFENLFLMSMCYESNWYFTTSILLCLGDELLVEERYMKWVQTQEKSNNEPLTHGFSGGSAVKNPAATQKTWIHFLDQEVPWEKENGNPFQYSCLGNPMDRGAWQAIVHGVTKSQTWLSN